MENLTNISVVQDLARRHGFHFSKGLGQNFLINPTVCPRIAELGNARPGFGVLEIGTGFGVLTAELAKRADKVVAVEIDQRLLPVLEETLADFDNVKIVPGDIMKIDVAALLRQEFGGLPVAVCANLPYYITSPILMLLLESRLHLHYRHGAEGSGPAALRPGGYPGGRGDHGGSPLLRGSQTTVPGITGQLYAGTQRGLGGDPHRSARKSPSGGAG